MSRFLPNAARSLNSLLGLIAHLVADGLRFFHLLLRSRTALSAEILFLRKQLAFYEERQVQPRRLNDKLTVNVSQTRFDALVDFAYNLGAKNLGKSTLLANINAGKEVKKENFTDWNRAGGKVVRGLTIRRTNEYNLFSNGEYGSP
jgi:Phage lysozyme